MRKALGGLLLLSGLAGVAHADEAKKPPYWASINAGAARMRTGPGRNYPASWLYQRADLPVKVVEVYQSWRKVEDPDGTQGWLIVHLLSDKRTAIVKDSVKALHVSPDPQSRVSWMAAPGVVGRISHCASGWCDFDVGGRGGYVEAADIWGVDPGEHVP
jgi:SH3-like domain-containing protein